MPESAVTSKRSDFSYDLANQLDAIRRYASTSTTSAFAATDYQFDKSGRLDLLDHRAGSTPGSGSLLAGYDFSWTNHDRLSKREKGTFYFYDSASY